MPTWSQARLLFTLAVAALIVMEPVSWMTASIPPCIVNPENYGAYYADHNYCPTFHVFLVKLLARVLEHFGDPNWVVADFTAVLALSTIILWIVTWQAGIRQSRDMKASIAAAEKAAMGAMIGARAAQKSADVSEKAFSNLERPYIFAFGIQRLEADTEYAGGFEPFVTYNVANYGKTPAIIENVRAGFSISKSYPDGPTRVDETHSLLISPILEAGEKREKLLEMFPSGMERTLLRDEDGSVYAIPAMESTEDLFFRIIIDYRGAFTEGHESSFCWRYDKSTAHFVQHGHQDYNYVA